MKELGGYTHSLEYTHRKVKGSSKSCCVARCGGRGVADCGIDHCGLRCGREALPRRQGTQSATHTAR